MITLCGLWPSSFMSAMPLTTALKSETNSVNRHQKARQLLADKVDPCVEKKASSYTFETVAREWRERWKASRHERHAHYVLTREGRQISKRLCRRTCVHGQDRGGR
jgi:hypothetical protein